MRQEHPAAVDGRTGTPSSGEIWVGNQAVSQLRPAKRNVAMVFQSYALYPHLSVRDNLGFGLRRMPSAIRRRSTAGSAASQHPLSA